MKRPDTHKTARQSIDGFTLRRRTGDPANLDKSGLGRPAIPHEFMRPEVARAQTEPVAAPEILPRPDVQDTGLRRADIDASLSSVDEERPKKKKRFRRIGLPSKKVVSLVLTLLVMVGVGYFAFKFMLATGRVFSGNVLDLFGSGVQLKADANGRTNIVIFGTSDDDEGHAGAALTDSIMLLSLDQEKKTAAMISMPRDMWVDYNEACISGYSGKINVVYMCGAADGDETKGAVKLKDTVGEIFGLEAQYYTKVNYTVLREVVDALGGITVTIQSSDPRGIYDYNTKIKYPNGPATLNGERALALARARGENISYGFDGSNFAREKNQQMILVAIRDKALSGGTLANPVAISGIIDALGNNLRSNFEAAEIKTLANLAKDISADKIMQLSLVDPMQPLVTTGSYSGQSIVRPIAGLTDYSAIQDYMKKRLGGGDVVNENASIEILNASTQLGIAGKKSDQLSEAGFVNIATGDTTYVGTQPVVWYDTTGGKKPKTAAKLASVLGKQSAGKTLPSGVTSDADFVILLGDE